MTKELAFLCRKCYSYAAPVCECNSLEVESLEHIRRNMFTVYCDNLNLIELQYVWKDERGEIVYTHTAPQLSNAVITNIPLSLKELKEVVADD